MAICLTTEHFWQLKVSQPAVNDVVIAGNSKAYLGISPSQIKKASGLKRVFNFGFVACCFDQKYMAHAASLLDMNSPKPSLVLGICPLCLAKSSPINGYNYWSSRSAPNLKDLVRKIRLDNFSGKAIIKTSARNLHNLSKGRPLSYYFPDGWEACIASPRQRSGQYVKSVRRLAMRKKVLPSMLEEFMQLVADFHQRGISVFAYRPPTAPGLRKLENGPSGLDWEKIALDFEKAGGTWIEINPDYYQTFDDAHMDYRNAIRLGQEIGKTISKN